MPRQQSIPGTEPDHPEVADAIDRWLEACERKKAASEAAAEADDVVVIKMLELGVQHYPYTDPESGKRKYRVVDTTPRGKSVGARPQPVEAMEPDEPEVSESTPPVEQVTHRKVSRKAATRELAEIANESKAKASKAKRKSDPMAQATDAIDGAMRPARDWDADDADASA